MSYDPIAGLFGALLGGLGVPVLLARAPFEAIASQGAVALALAVAIWAGAVEAPLLWWCAVPLLILWPWALARWSVLRSSSASLALVVVGPTAVALWLLDARTQVHDIARYVYVRGLPLFDGTGWAAAAVALLLAYALTWRGIIAAVLEPEEAQVRGVPVALLRTLAVGGFVLASAMALFSEGALFAVVAWLVPAVVALRVAPSPAAAISVATTLGAAMGWWGAAWAHG